MGAGLLVCHMLLGVCQSPAGPEMDKIQPFAQGGDVAAELVVCHVLLGAPEAATRLLRADAGGRRGAAAATTYMSSGGVVRASVLC